MKALVIDIRGLPEVMAMMCARVAELLREAADAEDDPRVAARLREIAAQFESGQ